MAFLAKLNVKGKTYNILNCAFNLYQNTDFHGQPAGQVRGGTISFNVEIPQDDPYTLWDWAADSSSYEDGHIDFMDPDTKNKVMVALKFTRTFVVTYAQSFSANDSSPISASMLISAMTIEYDAVKHENKWAKKGN